MAQGVPGSKYVTLHIHYLSCYSARIIKSLESVSRKGKRIVEWEGKGKIYSATWAEISY